MVRTSTASGGARQKKGLRGSGQRTPLVEMQHSRLRTKRSLSLTASMTSGWTMAAAERRSIAVPTARPSIVSPASATFISHLAYRSGCLPCPTTEADGPLRLSAPVGSTGEAVDPGVESWITVHQTAHVLGDEGLDRFRCRAAQLGQVGHHVGDLLGHPGFSRQPLQPPGIVGLREQPVVRYGERHLADPLGVPKLDSDREVEAGIDHVPE